MSNALLRIRPRSRALSVAFAAALLGGAGDTRSAPLGEIVDADSRTASAEVAEFRYSATKGAPSVARFTVDGEPAEPKRLIRWGAPAAPGAAATLRLADGSNLVTDRSWSASGYASVTDREVQLNRRSGWVGVPRGAAERLEFAPNPAGFFETPEDPEDAAGHRGGDAVWLIGGDRLDGRVARISAEAASVLTAGAETAIDVPISRVRAIEFGDAKNSRTGAHCLVGLAEGSLLRASEVAVSGERANVTTPAGLRLETSAADVVFLQPVGGAAAYLSDRVADDYQHTPYFDLAWPYARDEGLGGGALTVGGRRSAKGLAVHSAARLVYVLDGSAQRFQADLAIVDQPTGPIGSVVFRVYLVRRGGVEPAYTSPVIRGGQPPVPIDVPTEDASALVLVVDYADGGDTGDRAVWLDARLIDARS